MVSCRFADQKAIAGERVAVGHDVEVIAADHALGIGACRAGDVPHHGFDLLRDLVQLRQILAETLMPTGVRMPVASMSMRALIGMVQAFETPGNCSALSISATRLSVVTPGRHSSFGFRLMTVSNISVGAGSVEVSARPAFAVDGGHLREGLDDAVLCLQKLRRLGDRNPRQGRRHKEKRALIEVWHELRAEFDGGPHTRTQDGKRKEDA